MISRESQENLTAEQKKKRRLARNRESARECRRRKKEYADSLASELASLEAENLQLRLKLKIGVDSSTIKDEERDEILARIDLMLQEGTTDGEVKKEIELLQERYSDYGRDRTGAITFHLSQLRKCLVPTQTTRTLIWLMTCAPTFHKSDGTEKPTFYSQESELARLWRDLLDELKPTLDQKKKLVDFTAESYSPYPDLQESTDESNNIIDRLEEIMTTKNTSLETEMSMIHGVLTPRQVNYYIISLSYYSYLIIYLFIFRLQNLFYGLIKILYVYIC